MKVTLDAFRLTIARSLKIAVLDVIQEVIDLCIDYQANGMYFDVKVRKDLEG